MWTLVYILIESCVYKNSKTFIFLENNNIGHLLKISRDYFWPQKFLVRNEYIYYIFCTFSKMFKFVEIVVILTKKIVLKCAYFVILIYVYMINN